MVGHRWFHWGDAVALSGAAGTAPWQGLLRASPLTEWETANFPGNFWSNVIKVPRSTEGFQITCSWPKLLCGN